MTNFVVERGSLDRAGELIHQRLSRKRCAIVTDTNVAAQFGKRLETALRAAGIESVTIALPAGEQSKSLQEVGAICDQMIAAGLDRQSFVVGLGGGVIGDISGFVAAIFHRGIPHVLIPTTLLAMVDSSIGGKTGVNTAAGKNLLGAIHPPVLVIDDVDLLQTLPPRELRQGFAEIVKHAIIADAEMFRQLATFTSTRLDRLKRSTELGELLALIQRNIDIKSRIIAGDEGDESGKRTLLNFGHTIGHGIEAAGEYRDFLHGEAIALGMVAAANISMKRAGLPRDQRDAIVDLVRRFELPAQLPRDFPRDKILEAVKRDKKFEHGEVRFVLTPKIGSAFLSSDVTRDDIRDAVGAL